MDLKKIQYVCLLLLSNAFDVAMMSFDNFIMDFLKIQYICLLLLSNAFDVAMMSFLRVVF